MKNDVKDIELLQEKANQFIPLRKEKIAIFSDIVDNGINDPIDTIKKLINLLRAYDDKIEREEQAKNKKMGEMWTFYFYYNCKNAYFVKFLKIM